VVPSLTTVHVQCQGIGERAGKLLLEILRGDDRDDGPWHQPIDLGFTVVERDSTLHPKAERAGGS
jgi:DNA-binding LacI/PurR family transcriptional regulator